MNNTEINQWKKIIDQMSQEDMARLWRFTPTGHPCFNSTLPLHDYFKKRFESLGGMTPEMSKKIGW